MVTAAVCVVGAGIFLLGIWPRAAPIATHGVLA